MKISKNIHSSTPLSTNEKVFIFTYKISISKIRKSIITSNVIDGY